MSRLATIALMFFFISGCSNPEGDVRDDFEQIVIRDIKYDYAAIWDNASGYARLTFTQNFNRIKNDQSMANAAASMSEIDFDEFIKMDAREFFITKNINAVIKKAARTFPPVAGPTPDEFEIIGVKFVKVDNVEAAFVAHKSPTGDRITKLVKEPNGHWATLEL